MGKLEDLQGRYFEMLSRQVFVESELDYAKFANYHPLLEQLSSIKNSAVSVFDMHKREHIFASYNFDTLYGYDRDRIKEEDSAYFDAQVHPDDLLELTEVGIHMMEFCYAIPFENRCDYKLLNEYRIKGHGQKYIRVVEQHQVLELDKQGNVWLSLSVLDLSPRQEPDLSVQSTILNFKTGEIVDLHKVTKPALVTEPAPKLSAREREILSLIQRGHLSKEISEILSISVHTVNTHRQRILEKLDADNSIEAVNMASRLGLLA